MELTMVRGRKKNKPDVELTPHEAELALAASKAAAAANYKSWYERNKEKLAMRRKARYYTDAKYRNKILNLNVHNSEKRKELKALAIQDGSFQAKPKPPRKVSAIVMKIPLKGVMQDVQMMRVGGLAKIIGRSVVAIYLWEKSGLMPPTPFSLNNKAKKERLYTVDMANVVLAALNCRDEKLSKLDPGFRNEVVTGWASLGVEVAS